MNDEQEIVVERASELSDLDPPFDFVVRYRGEVYDLAQTPLLTDIAGELPSIGLFIFDGQVYDRSCIVTLEELSTAIDLSTTTIRLRTKQHENPMPMLASGKHGRGYRFYLPDVRRWLDAEKSRERDDERRRIEAKRSHILDLFGDEALSAAGGSDSHLPAEEQKKLAEAELKMMQAARARREHVKVQEVEHYLRRGFAAMRDRLRALPDQLQSEFDLTDDQVEEMLRFIDGALQDAADCFANVKDAEGIAA